MQAKVGDRIVVSGRIGMPELSGEIVEVRGNDGAPPYFVRFDDGYEQLVYPGPDSTISPA
ncbi:DUF1918 domain-containing protein [Streptomyces sp. NPDC050485]|uniref:DUF1918 domain-containing protein n=1 Tax=Streptomyces sp. NPDC050485 TaxID=3365617 RepID=UPI00378F8C8E